MLVSHWPLRYDLARPPRIPRFSIWCGTTRTEDWARRFRARVVVPGDLHLRTTLDGTASATRRSRSAIHGIGWLERGIDWYLRDVLPASNGELDRRFVPGRDPFFR